MPRVNWKQKCDKLTEKIAAMAGELDAKDEQMAQLEGKIESMREDFDCLKADRDDLQDSHDSQVRTASSLLESYRLERKRAAELEQKLTLVQLQAEAYLTYIAALKASLDASSVKLQDKDRCIEHMERCLDNA